MNAIIGNTGAAPWVVNYVKHYRAHLEGTLSYMNTLGTGSYGTDPSRVYTLQRARPTTTARPSAIRRCWPSRPSGSVPGRRSRTSPSPRPARRSAPAQGKRGRSIKVPYKGDGYFMGYSYDKKTKRYLRSMPWGPHVLADGTRVSTDNVLVIKAKQHYGKIFHGRRP